jgi:mevalonate kinase
MQRVAASEARNEGVKVREKLQEIARKAEATVNFQRNAVQDLREGWPMHVAENSKAAGAEMAKTFGKEIASGLQQRLEQLGASVERVTARFEWTTGLKWGLGSAAAMTIAVLVALSIFVKAIEPEARGLSPSEVRQAMARLTPCQVDKAEHVCIALEDNRVVAHGQHGEGYAIVRGM